MKKPMPPRTVEILAPFPWKLESRQAEQPPEPRPVNGPEDYGSNGAGKANGAGPLEAPPLTLTDWLKRDLPASDLLLPWLSTTSRVLIAANWAACNETMAWILK